MQKCTCKYYCDVCDAEVDSAEDLITIYMSYGTDKLKNGEYSFPNVALCKKCKKVWKQQIKKLEHFLGVKFTFEKFEHYIM